VIPFAVLCPGQGGQSPDLFERFPFTAIALDLKDQILKSGCLSPEVAGWLEDPKAEPHRIYEDRYAQPLICLFQAMVWAELSHRLPKPQLIAGYSLGELSAYGCAGVLSPEDWVSLASTRARLMDEAAPVGRLVAVTGMDVEQATSLAQRHGGYVAIVVARDHCILACRADASDDLLSEARTAARTTTLLKVSIAAHTPLLDTAVEPFRYALETTEGSAFRSAVLAGVNAAKISSKQQMVRWLPEQIHHTIRWDLILSRLSESNCRVLLEIGPGTQLSRIALTNNPTCSVRSVSEFRTVEGIVAWVNKSIDRTST